MEPPQNPAGVFVTQTEFSDAGRRELIAVIGEAPAILRNAVGDLSEDHLEVKYRNWSIRQIVHHLADSHLNSYIRFKWALTEESPVIKAYDESRWAALEDSSTGDIQPALALLQGLHARWVLLLQMMTEDQFAMSFIHPETGQAVSLNAALCYYAWHSQHHTAQIQWLRDQKLFNVAFTL